MTHQLTHLKKTTMNGATSKLFQPLFTSGKLFNEMLAVIGFYFGGFYLKETIS